MEAENKSTEKPKKSKGLKLALTIAAAVLILIVLIVVVGVPAYISSESARQMILTKINESAPGKADFASLSMGWFKGIKLSDFSFDDSDGAASVRIKQITTKPHYGAILGGALSFGKTVVDTPRVNINLQNMPGQAERAQDSDTAESLKTVALPIDKIDLIVTDGLVSVTNTGAKTVQLANINSHVDLKPAGSKSTFNLDAEIKADTASAPIHAEGSVKPKAGKDGWTLEGTSGNFIVETKDLDLESLESFFAAGGVAVKTAGIATGKVSVAVKDGQLENLNSDLRGSKIELSGQALKGDTFKTSSLVFTSNIETKKNLLAIKSLDVQADWLTATASGDIPTNLKSISELINAKSDNPLKANLQCNLAQLASQMPKTLGLKPGTSLTGGDLTADISKANGKLSANAKLANLTGSVDGKAASLSAPVTVDALITGDKDTINFDKLDLTSSFAQINAKGSTESLDYNAKVDLDKLQSELGQFVDMKGYRFAGLASESGTIKTTKETIGVKGTAQLNNLKVTSPENITASEPAASFVFDMTVNHVKNFTDIRKFSASGTFGTLEIDQAKIPHKKDTTDQMSLPVKVKNLDLAKIRAFAALANEKARQTTVAGIADGQVNLSKKASVMNISTSAVTISDFKYAFADKKPFEDPQVTVTFNAEIDSARKNFALTDLKVIGTKISIRQGDISKTERNGLTELKGNLDIEYDWQSVMALAGDKWPANLALEGKRKDNITFESKYPTSQDALLANLNTSPKVGFTKASYLGLVFEPTEMGVNVTKGLFTLNPFESKVNNGSVSFAASANFNDQTPILKTPAPMQIVKNVNLNPVIAEKLLKYINPVFVGIADISGAANLQCERLAIPLKTNSVQYVDIEGTFWADKIVLQSPFINAISKIGGGSRQDTTLTVRPTKFTVRNGMLNYDNMQIDVGDNPLNFTLKADLISRSISGRVVTPYTASGRTYRVGDPGGSDRIAANIKGTIDKPELDIVQAVTDTLIKRGLEELLKNR